MTATQRMHSALMTHPFRVMLFFLRLTSLLSPNTTSRYAMCCFMVSDVDRTLMDDKLHVSGVSCPPPPPLFPLLTCFDLSFCSVVVVVVAALYVVGMETDNQVNNLLCHGGSALVGMETDNQVALYGSMQHRCWHGNKQSSKM